MSQQQYSTEGLNPNLVKKPNVEASGVRRIKLDMTSSKLKGRVTLERKSKLGLKTLKIKRSSLLKTLTLISTTRKV